MVYTLRYIIDSTAHHHVTMIKANSTKQAISILRDKVCMPSVLDVHKEE